MVADFLTRSAEAVIHAAQSPQFGFVNRQLCGSSEGSRGGSRQHGFSSISKESRILEKLSSPVHNVHENYIIRSKVRQCQRPSKSFVLQLKARPMILVHKVVPIVMYSSCIVVEK